MLVTSLFYIIFVIVTIYWIIIKWMNRRIDHHLKNLPGPKPVIFLGNLLDFAGGSQTHLSAISSYIDKHGDTVLVYLGSRIRAVVTVDYKFVELVLNSSTHIDKSVQYDLLHNWLGLGLLTSSGTTWRTHRKMITPSFHFSMLLKYVEILHDVGDTLIERLQKEVGNASLEITQIISHYALDVICEAAMGVKINALLENSRYVKSIKLMCEYMIFKTRLPIHPVFFPLFPVYWKERRTLKYIHNFVENVIEKRRVEVENEESCVGSDLKRIERRRLAFLDVLLKSTIDGQPLTKREIRDEVNTFMFEGHDTTTAAMSFCLYMLSLHPECQKKVYNEQKRLFGDNLTNIRPTYAELNEMKYLELVIKETLRLFPPVPLVGRKLGSDFEYNGTLYPKGLNVGIYTFGYHRRSKYFPDPEKFIPERFESQDERLPFSYIPFSAGSRNCIGQKFAMLEVLSTISKVVRQFELVQATPEHNVILAPEVILISKNGIRLGIKSRI